MNYKEYLKIYQTRKSLGVNAGDLDLYGKFPPVTVERYDGAHKDDIVYRCHLSDDFLRVLNLPYNRAEVSYSLGVRATLEVLANLYGDVKWMIPADSYPFYQKVLQSKKVTFSKFNTFDLEDDTLSLKDTTVLLLTDPLKPSSLAISKSWLEDIEKWLKLDSAHQLIVDTVYVVPNEIDPQLQLFYQTFPGQVSLLTSLSKMMAAPLIAGFTISNNELVRSALRQLEKPPEETLKKAHFLLNDSYGLERKEDVAKFLKVQLLKAKELGFSVDARGLSYLWKGTKTLEEYEKMGIYLIPASVYNSGSRYPIFSSLGL